MSLRAAILDDEPLAVEILSEYVRQHAGLELVQAGTDPFAALRLVQSGGADLLFLDVQMPELTGIQFLKIAGGQCAVILTTAYPDYAIDGYEYDVADYLLKPVSPERFSRAVARVAARVAGKTAAPDAPADHFYLRSEHRLVRIAYSDILFVEALRDYVAVHLADGGKVLSLEPLRDLESLLPAGQFMRIHKSYLVALGRISYIERGAVQIGGRSLPVGPTYKEAVAARTERK